MDSKLNKVLGLSYDGSQHIKWSLSIIYPVKGINNYPRQGIKFNGAGIVNFLIIIASLVQKQTITCHSNNIFKPFRPRVERAFFGFVFPKLHKTDFIWSLR